MKTAHALANGFILNYEDSGESKLVAMEYGGNYVELEGEILETAIDLLDKQEASILPSEMVETLENANFVGRETNFAELKDAEISYSVDDAATPFEQEVLNFRDTRGKPVTVMLPGELIGRYENYVSPTVEDSDPLTAGEAAWLIEKIGGEPLDDVTPEALKGSTSSFLVPALAEVADKVQTYLEQMDHHNWVISRPVPLGDGNYERAKTPLVPRHLGLYSLLPNAKNDEERERKLADLCRRMFHTVKAGNVGGPWAHDSIWTTSEREGVTDIMEELAIKGLSPQAQYIDCDIPDLEKAARDESRPSMFNQMYDEHGKNRGWSDRSLFYYRRKQERLEHFHTLMDAVMTLPEQLVIKHFLGRDSDFQRSYRESIRECSPGPARKLVDGRWLNMPLTGMDAIQVLIRKGYAAFSLHKDVKYHRGEKWHAVMLDKQMKEELDRAIQIRLRSYSERLDERVAAMPEQFPAYVRKEVIKETALVSS